MKWAGIVAVVLVYLISSAFITIAPIVSREKRRIRTRSTSFFSRLALRVFGLRVQIKQREPIRTRAGGMLVVCNHVSYIDIVVLSSVWPAVFITSMELKSTPLLGILAQCGGSLFVERRKAAGLKREIENIATVLKQGFLVVLFPEGTTTNGDRVQEFKKSLFDCAVAAGSDILPVCLRYRKINGQPVSAANRNAVFYYGGVSFSKHFPGFMSLRSVDVEMIPLKTIRTRAHYASRKQLAKTAHDAISSAYFS